MSRRKKRHSKSRKKSRKHQDVIFSFLLLVVIAQVIFILYLLPRQTAPKLKEIQSQQQSPPRYSEEVPSVIIESVENAPTQKEQGPAQKSDFSAQTIKTQEKPENSSAQILPKQKSATDVAKEATNANKKATEVKLASSNQNRISTSKKEKADTIKLVKLPVEIVPQVFKAPKIKGKIAIVLDDWGYNASCLSMLKQITQPVTIAVLPNLPYSRRSAFEAKRKNFEVILHLPMEPLSGDYSSWEKDTITTEMDDATIRTIFARQLASIPYAKGVNNHMGSKATSDYRVMKTIFECLKKRKLYFLDSFVTSGSVAKQMARMTKVRFARRDIFLDNEEDPEYISSQLERLKEKAQDNGVAIGIGHARPNTLKVLVKELPRIKKEGYKFVLVSEVLEKY